MGQSGSLKGNLKIIELNKNGKPIYQHLWDTAKAVQKENFIAPNAYIRKE